MSITLKLVKKIVRTKFENLPSKTIKTTKKCILDTLGAMIAGTSALGCSTVVNIVKEWGGKHESTIMIYGVKAPAHHVALANAMMARARDIDDVNTLASVHVSATTVPVGLCMAEKEKASGKDLILAIALGADLLSRMALANKIPPGISGMNATWQCGTFAAAATAGKILDLDDDQMLNALGIAYSQVAGNSQAMVEGALTVRLQQGLSAKSGILAAEFAQKGITGAKEALEGKFGYYNVYQRGEYDPSKLTEKLDKEFKGDFVSFKKYPCCMHTHAAIDAILKLAREKKIQPEDIQEITVYVNEQAYYFTCYPLERKRTPQSIVDAQFSLPYVVATAIVKGDVFINDFSEESINDPKVLEVASKVKPRIFLDERKAKGKEISPSTVKIKTMNGKVLSKSVKFFKGHYRNPLSTSEIIKKFEKCVLYSIKPLSKENIKKIVRTIMELEKIGDVTELIELVT